MPTARPLLRLLFILLLSSAQLMAATGRGAGSEPEPETASDAAPGTNLYQQDQAKDKNGDAQKRGAGFISEKQKRQWRLTKIKQCTGKRFSYRIYRKYNYRLKDTRSLTGFETARFIDPEGNEFICLATLRKSQFIQPADIVYKAAFNPAGRNPEYVAKTFNLMPSFEWNRIYTDAYIAQSITGFTEIIDRSQGASLGATFSLPALFRRYNFLYFGPQVRFGQVLTTDNVDINSYQEGMLEVYTFYHLLQWKDMTAYAFVGGGLLYEQIEQPFKSITSITTTAGAGLWPSFRIYESLHLGPVLAMRFDFKESTVETKASFHLRVSYRL